MVKRSDPHRPGALIPADYEQHVDYDLGGPWPELPIGVDCTRPMPVYGPQGERTGVHVGTHGTGDRCCVMRALDVARAEGRAVFGGLGKCGVCGAHFRYGTMFRHVSGALVHMGHDCANKYSMMYDQSATERERGRLDRALATAVRREQNAAERAAFLDAHPGLAADLEVDHPIIADIAQKFVTYRTMSDKQVALVHKLADEVRNPKPVPPEEIKVPAPFGKGVVFEGVITSAKLRTSEMYGSTWKIAVRVPATVGDGHWIAWGSAPAGIMKHVRAIVDSQRGDREALVKQALVGMVVEIKSTLEKPAPRDTAEIESDAMRAQIESRNAENHFAFMVRPSGSPVTWNHPERSAKRIAAERAFEKAVYEKRIALKQTDERFRYTYAEVPHELVLEALAAEGVTFDGMIEASLAKPARKPRKAKTATEVQP
jgi:hypothetical protein